MKSERLREIYFWLTNGILVIFIIVTICLQLKNVLPDWDVFLFTGVSVFGTMLTLLLSSQKQALEEHKEIRKLFKDFNDSYHEMNDKLNYIKESKIKSELSEEDKNFLYDYFNLCAEEYLYFKRDLIYPEVWQAWCKGILDYMKNERIHSLWAAEEKTGSYYGLTYEIIAADGGRGARS